MNKKKINVSVNLLKAWMAMEVLLLHRCNFKEYSSAFVLFLKNCTAFSVPVFMMLTFYFSQKLIVSDNKEKFQKRVIRLLKPQIFWAFIYWGVYALTDVVFEHRLEHSVGSLIVQMLTGSSKDLNPTMWFQFVLLILTVLFFFVFSIFKEKKGWIVSWLLLTVSLMLQFSGINYSLFMNAPFAIRYTFGRFAEMIPYAVIGMAVAKSNLIDRISENKRVTIVFSLLMFSIVFVAPFPKTPGFDFSGLYPMMAIFLVLLALVDPLSSVGENTHRILIACSRFTMGVYCGHRLVYAILYRITEMLIPGKIGSLLMCVIVYICCYLLSWMLLLIPEGKGLVE